MVVVIHGLLLSDVDGIYPGETGSELESWLVAAEADVLVAGDTHAPSFATLPAVGWS